MIKAIVCGILFTVLLINPLPSAEAKNIDKWVDIINKIDLVSRRISPVTIYPDGLYHTGILNYVESSKNKTEAYRYHLIVSRATNIKLHFISHVENYMDIQMIDSDENIIKPFSRRLNIKNSPFTHTLALAPGKYTFSVYCLKRVGNKAQSGDFRFKFEEVAPSY